MSGQKLFGRRLRELRQYRGLTLERLGERVGYSGPWLGLLERAKRNVTCENAEQLAAALGTTLARLLNPDVPVSALLEPCGNCKGKARPGWRCLSCGLQGSLEEAA